MLCVETIGKIRRRRLVQGESISAIARDLGLSRNTVKRALRSEGERFEYRRSSQPRPKLGPFLETLEAWLEAEDEITGAGAAHGAADLRGAVPGRLHGRGGYGAPADARLRAAPGVGGRRLYPAVLCAGRGVPV